MCAARRRPKRTRDAAAELKKTEEAVREAARQLAAEAQHQEENGATNAATRLDDMAKMLQGEPLKKMLAQAQTSPRDSARAEELAKKLDDLAERAGQQRNPAPLSRQELSRLVDRLQRTQANLKNLASQCTSPGASSSGQSGKSPGASQSPGTKPGTGNSDGPAHARAPELSRGDMQREEAAQLLDELRLGGMDASAEPSGMIYVRKLDKVLSGAAQKPISSTQDIVPLVADLNPPLTGLINSLQVELAGMRRQFGLTSVETEPAPAAYRAAVADYFEQVSHDYQPARNEPVDAH